jgi:hypothetical protein
MIYAPRGWTRHSTADGMLLVPPGASEVCHIIYRERVRPLVPVLEIFRHALGGAKDVDATTLRPRLAVTAEGEYAAVATIRSAAGDVQHDLGVVLLDDFYSLLHGVTRDPARWSDTSRQLLDLLVHDLHQLSHRRRRYLYDAPGGWQGRPRGLETDYFPLDYPKQDLMISVLPALPRPQSGTSAKYLQALLEEQKHEVAVADIGGLANVRTQHLPGHELNWTALFEKRQVGRRVVVLEDDRFLYPVFLEGTSDLEAARETFVALVNSIEPIPGPGGATPAQQSAAALNLWGG